MAVERTRAAEALTNLRALQRAGQEYMLVHGSKLNATLESLSVSINGLTALTPTSGETKNFKYSLGTKSIYDGILFATSRKPEATKYVITILENGKMYCCWFEGKYENICRGTAGLDKTIPAEWHRGSLGCVSNF
jgi:hypothetical protein